MAFKSLEKLHQLQDGYRRVFRVNGEEILLLCEFGKTYLIKNACPHMGASLARATLVDKGLRCPLHGMVFELEASCGAAASACVDQLIHIPIIYEGNSLGVWVED